VQERIEFARKGYNLQFQQLFDKINFYLAKKEHIVAAIDGKSGAGKSSLAKLLKETFSCDVISMDHFFLRPAQRTAERLSTPGGNIDFERFGEEVLKPLKNGEPFIYRPYDCKTGKPGGSVDVNPKPLVVIEGVYSMHPIFTEAFGAYDVSVFLDIDSDDQRRRLYERNPDMLERFISEWIPMENMYFEHFRIPEKCDLVFECE